MVQCEAVGRRSFPQPGVTSRPLSHWWKQTVTLIYSNPAQGKTKILFAVEQVDPWETSRRKYTSCNCSCRVGTLSACDFNLRSLAFCKQLLRSWVSSQSYPSRAFIRKTLGRLKRKAKKEKQSGRERSLCICSERLRGHSRWRQICSDTGTLFLSESRFKYCCSWRKSCGLDFKWLRFGDRLVTTIIL